MKTLIDEFNGHSVSTALTMPKEKLILALYMLDKDTEYDFQNASEDELRNLYLTKILDLTSN